MKTNAMKSILCCFFLLTSGLYSQNNSGIVYYQGVINQKHVNDFLKDLETKKDIPMHIKQEVVRMYKYASPDDYVLNFKDGESYFYFEAPLERQAGDYNVGSKAGLNSFYTNNKSNKIIMMGSTLGDVIIERDIQWRITQKTKMIGKYLCYQAIYEDQSDNDNKTIAWFSPEIPLNFGPKYYKGLPGLILQIENDKFILTALKIKLNPNENEVKIKRVKNEALLITEKEFSRRAREARSNSSH